ncbi:MULTISPECIES: hypothetical protein [Exiguobacterium]|mgnify:FL=1|uniref:hypothetical protein n=1 Tax=Exiguobacterium TaxID=33986 RepID=UPI0007D85D48|nr:MULTISPECIES: hypothetical protein [unclassified Exiguobacterium]OAI82802.1 hypothetical protein AYO36_15135 [Exiguobacterium sp. KKBO11]
MKRVVTQSLLNCCLYFLAAYLISAIHANLKLFQDDPVSGTGLSLELNLMGVIPVLMISIALSIVSYFLREDRSRSFATAEFSDSDEREAQITGKATRAAYVAFMISLPVLMIAFLFEQPLLQLFPAFPFYAIALILSVGTLTYMTAWIVHVRR